MFPNIRQTIVFRLTSALGVVLVAAVVSLLGLTFVLTETQLSQRYDQMLSKETRFVSSVPRARMPQAIDALIANSTSGLNYYGLVGADGRLVAGNFALPSVPRAPGPFNLPAGQAAPAPLRALVTQLPDGTRIEVARDISPIVDLRQRIFAIVAISGCGVIVAAVLAGVLLSLGPLRRVGQARAVAMRIAAGELGLRMPTTPRGDELDLMSGMVNAMLDEIERLMEQVKGATDAIAHDLRTPLAHLRHRLQALAHDNEADPTAPVVPAVAEAIEDIDHVLRRFNALLRISELEASGRHAGFAPLDPLALLAGIAELYEPLAEEHRIGLSLHGIYGQLVLGDETLLLEAFSNLIENALKFVGSGGHVVLSVASQSDATVIEVRDNGPGIAEAERALVLRRFKRGSGAGCTAGTGLGLHLVAAIVHLHGFTMLLEDANPGLNVKISCPRRAGNE
jgi:signal transduction histidine kinase